MTEYTIGDVSSIMEGKMDAVMDAVEFYMRRWAVEAKSGARMDAPRRTGRLSSSLTSNVRRAKKAVTAVIGTNLEYAPYNEYGTGDRGSNEYNGHVSEEVTFTAGWPGMDPFPYLRPQIYDKETEIVEGLKDTVRRVLDD